ncbi:YDG domain-containing protein [Clostridium sp. AF22-10]|uniref:YDG domain-containing protein n=1 Tax=Clostridium sp. AF22-10 TaxID=2293004 RepID=UPI0011C21891
MNENTAVTVVKCSHPDDPSGGNVCPYCGYAAAATKTDGSISYYLTADAAIAAADGGTVKLLANAGEITIGSPLKLDLNGKTAAKLTVTGNVTLASLLPEGYVFKSGSTWITDLTGKELTNVSMAKIPIKSMDYPNKMSMTYGGTGTLLVNVNKESGTGAVSFQWYKVENGKETAVDNATKNQFDLSTQKLPADQHTFRFLATCDGYKKMSQDIVVTVQKADIRSSLITPPTAQENLTYTGQEQALITAGSVTSGGTMQYSLTENGTYSLGIPTGTDAGTYTVWYRVIGDANHNDTAPASVEVSIGKKPLTISGVTAVSKPYDGTTDAGITSVTFDGMNLNRGTD